jgi:DNA-binding CsgD family transcriptional regulator
MRRALRQFGPVPDGIEPISGYRMWTYSLRRWGTYLHSLSCHGIPSCPWEAAGSDWVFASCVQDPYRKHRVPDEGCTCGVYALTAVDDVFEFGLPYETGNGDGALMGRVELAGKIIEHERGYRAKRARIAELIPIEGATRDAMRIARRLGIPLSPPAPLPAKLSEAELQVLELIASDLTISEVGNVLGISSREAELHLHRAKIAISASERTILGPPRPLDAGTKSVEWVTRMSPAAAPIWN